MLVIQCLLIKLVITSYSIHYTKLYDDRAFVLLPIKDIALNWSHPISNKNVLELIKTIPPEQKIMTLSDYSDRFASK